MTVDVIKDLFEHGQYQAILERLVQQGIQAQVAALSESDQGALRYYHSRALTELGQFQQGLKVATTAHTTLQATNKQSPLLLASLSAQVRALKFQGEIDAARQLLTEGDALLQDLTVDIQAPAALWIPVFELTKGIFNLYKNRDLADASLSQALADFEKLDTPSHLAETLLSFGLASSRDTMLEYYQRSLAIYEKLEHNAGIASVFLNMGFLFYYRGEINHMTEYFRRSLTFAEASSLPGLIANALRYVGFSYMFISKFDTALGYSQRALALSESIGDKGGVYDAAMILGSTYYSKGELDQAFDYYQRSLNYVTLFQEDIMIAKVLTGLVLVTLARQDSVQAQAYLIDLQNTASRLPESQLVQFRSRLMEALVSKGSPRMADKGHAQTILKQLVTEEYFALYWELAMLGLLHLCDLLIYEARATGEGEAWKEAKTILDQFYIQTQDKKSTEFTAEALLMQAKFALIDGELQQAQTYLIEAKTVATELDRGLLIARVEAEQAQLTTDFEKWTNLIRRNATLQERLMEARLEEYLQKAQDTLTRYS